MQDFTYALPSLCTMAHFRLIGKLKVNKPSVRDELAADEKKRESGEWTRAWKSRLKSAAAQAR
jgi:hypothetical protein